MRFAADLRRLRNEAGAPTYRELSRRAHYSVAALSEAASGRKLPSLAVTSAYVAACGGDVESWQRRWQVLAAELAPAPEAPDGSVQLSPYRGMAAFQPEDAASFFGRDRLVERLCGLVARRRLAVVLGPSGSGKSSLLRAGLIARANNGALGDGAAWPALVMTPGPRPVQECAARLAARVRGSAVALYREMSDAPDALHLAGLQLLADRPAAVELLIVVDQFEELFTLCRDLDERMRFVRLLTTAADAPNSRVRIVLGVRADFYVRCAQLPELVEPLNEGQILVGPMGPAELRQAVTKPAVLAGYRVETALVTQVIADAAGQPGVLPHVSHALLETWRRRQGTTLTLAGYQTVGGIEQAAARTAEEVYASLTPSQQGLARRLFVRLVSLGDGTEDTRRSIARAELEPVDPDTGTVLERLAHARLIILDRDRIDLAHEALVRSWPRLTGWLAEDRDGLRVHRQLTEGAYTWLRIDRDPGALFRGSRLEQAQAWADGHGTAELSAMELEFLRQSLAARAGDRATARRRARRMRQLLALLAMLLVVASTAAVVAVRAQRETAAQRNLALAQKGAAQAVTLRDSDPALALQLGLAAYRLAPHPDTRSALLNMFVTPYAARALGHTDMVASLDVAAHGRLLVTGSRDTTVRLWDISNPRRPEGLAVIRDIPVGVDSVVISPDGRLLAASGIDVNQRPVVLWDITDARVPRRVAALTTGVGGLGGNLTFSPDGRILAVTGADRAGRGSVSLWDLGDPTRPRTVADLPGPTGAMFRIALSPDGHTMAVAAQSISGRVAKPYETRLWDVARPAAPVELATLTGVSGNVNALAFSPDGRTLATTRSDGLLRLWDTTNVRQPRPHPPLVASTGSVTALAFSPDGHTLATGGDDSTVRLWDVSDARVPQPMTTLDGPAKAVMVLGFTPDGNTLAMGSVDTTVRLEDITEYAYPDRSRGAGAHVAFSPDGRTLATGGLAGEVDLWDVSAREHPRFRATLSAGVPRGLVVDLAFRGDGGMLVVGTLDGTVTLWDTSTAAAGAAVEIGRIGPHGPVAALGLSPDGTVLAVANSPYPERVLRGHPDGQVRLWSLARPASPAELGTLPGLPRTTVTLAFSHDGRVLLTGAGPFGTRLWDVADPTRPRATAALPVQPGVSTVAVSVSPVGGLFAVAHTDDTVRIWDVAQVNAPRLVTELRTGSQPRDVAFSPDGTMLAVGLDSSVKLWSMSRPRQPQEASTLRARTGTLAVAVSRGSAMLAAIGNSRQGPHRSLQLWHTDTVRMADRICSVAWPRLTRGDWDKYLPGVPFQPPCP